MKLLTRGNPKIAKSQGLGVLTLILHLAPSGLAGVGNMCLWATAACIAACLNTAGRGGILAGSLKEIRRGNTNAIQKARIARTRFYALETDAFLTALVKEMQTAIKYAAKHGLEPVFRLNGTSDLRVETWRYAGQRFLDCFSDVILYDYTKSKARVLQSIKDRNWPKNYFLAFSRAENNDHDAVDVLTAGGTVACVVAGDTLEARLAIAAAHFSALGWNGRVVDGDKHDLIYHYHDAATLLVLKAKGRAKLDASGFVLR